MLISGFLIDTAGTWISAPGRKIGAARNLIRPMNLRRAILL